MHQIAERFVKPVRALYERGEILKEKKNLHTADETRFQKMKRTHPRLYEYCINGGAYDSDGLWKPDKNGLGMKHVFDELNKIYGDNFIRYK